MTVLAARPWLPLLADDPPLRARANAILAALVEARRRCLASPPSTPRIAVGRAIVDRGAAGWAILHDVAARTGFAPAATTGDEVRACLDLAAEAVGEHEAHTSLSRGFVGVYWAHQRLAGDDDEVQTSLDDLDAGLLDFARQAPREYGHDLLEGLPGLAVYALDRWPRPGARALLAAVVEQLLARASHEGEHVRWFTPPGGIGTHRSPSGLWDLGMARGMAGIISALAAAAARDVHADRARAAIAGCARWILGQRLEHRAGSLPVYISVDEGVIDPTQGWCYGDPGVAWALLLAARTLGDVELEHAAIDLARGTAGRSPDQGKVKDGNFCHGAGGIAHILHRMWQVTGDQALADGARAWYGHALAFHDALPTTARPGTPWPADPADPVDGGPELDLRLLYGETGLALALIAAATPVEPSWDRFFLVDWPG